MKLAWASCVLAVGWWLALVWGVARGDGEKIPCSSSEPIMWALPRPCAPSPPIVPAKIYDSGGVSE